MKLYFVTALLSVQIASLALGGSSQSDANKKLVRDFYDRVFIQHDVKDAAEEYLRPSYIQHNPNVATGRQPFIDFFVPFFSKNPDARSEIKRVIAEGDLVVLHVHSKINKDDRGRAVVDIFRVEGGKIAEHWDVMQAIPEKSANNNTVF
jgi:predicted SnoaL-like aldol condensation-catalyzing enzyme